MNRKLEHQIVPGILLNAEGDATVSNELSEVLGEFAEELGTAQVHPVDAEHVLVAVILAVRAGEIPSDASLSANDPQLSAILAPHVAMLLDRYGQNICESE